MPKPPKRPPRSSDDAIVDKLLKQLPHADPKLRGDPEPPKRPPPQRAAPAGRPPPVPSRPTRPSWKPAWAWASGAIVLAVGLSQWPYPRACGFALAGYAAVVVLLIGLAGRAAVASWTGRRGVAHVFALLTLLSGMIYAAEVVLPRIGYATQEATWACVEEPVIAPIQPMAADTIVVDTPPDSVPAGTADSLMPTTDTAGGPGSL